MRARVVRYDAGRGVHASLPGLPARRADRCDRAYAVDDERQGRKKSENALLDDEARTDPVRTRCVRPDVSQVPRME